MGNSKLVRRRAKKGAGDRVEAKFRFSPEVAAKLSAAADAAGMSVSLLGESIIRGVLEAAGDEPVLQFVHVLVYEKERERREHRGLFERSHRNQGDKP